MTIREAIGRWLAARPAGSKAWEELSPGTQAAFRFDADRLIDSLKSQGFEIVLKEPVRGTD